MGRQRLQKAITAFVDRDTRRRVEVEWKPFIIDPGTDPKGETVEEYCNRRWGGSGWTEHLKAEGQKEDGGAHFANWKWWPNTNKAHQLVEYCRRSNNDNNCEAHTNTATNRKSHIDGDDDALASTIISTDRVNELLFHYEYEQGENISLVDVLLRIGKDAGIDNMADLEQYLSHDMGKIEVERDITRGRNQYGISSVPYFIIAPPSPVPFSSSDDNDNAAAAAGSRLRPYGLSGAQSSTTFLDIFEELMNTNTQMN